MKKKQIQLQLTKEQRAELERFSKTGIHSARLITRANIILLLDTSENKQDIRLEEIAKQQKVSMQTIQIVRRDYLAANSVSAFLQRKKRETPPVEPKVTGEVEARIIALACSKAPDGYGRWTLELLADRSVKIKIIDAISPATVGRILKKRNFSLT